MKSHDWLSERMVFGLLIIGGYLGALLAVTFKTDIGAGAQNLISTGMGVLGTAIGAIVAAIWKTDKVERQAAETAAVLASKAPDLSGTGAGVLATKVEVVNDPANPVPTTEATDPFTIKP